MNARYQKNTEPKGQTRKSAAAAKPSRKQAGSSSSKSDSSAKRKRPAGKTFWEPDTPEYRNYRRIWWWSLGIGFLVLAASFATRWVPAIHNQPWSAILGFVLLGLAYAAILVAVIVDWVKMRPLRTAGPDGKPPTKTQAAKPADKDESKTDTAENPGDAGDSGETE